MQNDSLFQLLMRAKDRPAVLTGTKSLLALTSFVGGYTFATEVPWYNEFADYVKEKCDAPNLDVYSAILKSGCNDENGVDAFYRYMQQFSNYVPVREKPILQAGEMRILRMNANAVCELAISQLHEHCDKYFGLSEPALLFSDFDGSTLTSAMVSDYADTMRITSPDPQIAAIPIQTSTEKLRHTTIIDTPQEILVHLHQRHIPVYEAFSDSEVQELAEDSDLHIDLARALVNDIENSAAEAILCRLAKDEDEIVRMEAVDSLSAFASETSVRCLTEALQDEDELVRTYAITGLGDLCNAICQAEIRATLLSLNLTEHSELEHAAIYGAWYQLGQTSALQNLFDLFRCPDPYAQCWCIRTLADLSCAENQAQIRAFLQSIDGEAHEQLVLDAIHDLKEAVL